MFQPANKKMKNTKILQIVKNMILIETGLMISSIGTSLFYSAELGSSAMSTFCDGLHILANMNYGTANILANIVFFITLLFLDKKSIGIGTVLCVFTIGPWVNLFVALLAPFRFPEANLLLRTALAVAGACLMGAGLGLYMSVNSGFGALEGIVKYVCRKFTISIKSAKIAQDAILSISGILLGGKWGIGTLIGIFLTGPVLQLSNSYFSAMNKKPAGL